MGLGEFRRVDPCQSGIPVTDLVRVAVAYAAYDDLGIAADHGCCAQWRRGGGTNIT